MSITESELEAVPELEEELEEEWEGELEEEGELEAEMEAEEEWEEEYEGEEEWEEEYEGEYEANPILRAYPDALIEHLGHAAFEAESEAEAEAFIGALVPMAAKLIPRVAPAVMKAAPKMISQAAKVTRILRKSPATKPLVRAVPSIVKRTTQSLANQAARGKTITPQTALRALQRQTLRVLRNPAARRRAIRHARVADHRFHRLPGTARMLPGRAPLGPRGTGLRLRPGRPAARHRPGVRLGPRRYLPHRRRGRPSGWGGGYGPGRYGYASGGYGPVYGPGLLYPTACSCCGQPMA